MRELATIVGYVGWVVLITGLGILVTSSDDWRWGVVSVVLCLCWFVLAYVGDEIRTHDRLYGKTGD